MTVCLYLPDGRVGFMFKRPHIDGHDAHDAGGLRFEVVEPYVEHRVTYDGEVCVLAAAARHGRPAVGVRRQPARAVHDRPAPRRGRRSRGAASPSGRRARLPDRRPRERVRPRAHRAAHGDHRDGHGRRRAFELTDGLGFRDHSWGPRYWQSDLVVPLADGQPRSDLGFALTVSRIEDGRPATSTASCTTSPATATTAWVPIREVELHLRVRRRVSPLPRQATSPPTTTPTRSRARVVEHPAAQPAATARSPASPRA